MFLFRDKDRRPKPGDDWNGVTNVVSEPRHVPDDPPPLGAIVAIMLVVAAVFALWVQKKFYEKT